MNKLKKRAVIKTIGELLRCTLIGILVFVATFSPLVFSVIIFAKTNNYFYLILGFIVTYIIALSPLIYLSSKEIYLQKLKELKNE